MKAYRPRIADRILARKLAGKGAVLIEGPKWCGKTTTAEQVAASTLYLGDPSRLRQFLTLAEVAPAQLLQGETPRLLDEWQVTPTLWDAVRFEVDHRDRFGQFILTGSAVPPKAADIIHTGTGRFAWLRMRPMALAESGESTGAVSLEGLFASPGHIAGSAPDDLTEIAFLTCRGGWPKAVGLSERIALDQAIDYTEAVIRTDASRVDGVTRNPDRVRALLRAYARHLGTSASAESLRADIAGNLPGTLAANTLASYTDALHRIFVIEDAPAWNPNLRSKAAIRSADTRYFTDPSVGAAALGIGPKDLLNDLNTFGFLFENLCVRDLRVYADAIDGRLYHYRDKNGLECDAVIHRRDGSYGLVEIKLGGDRALEEGAATLLKLESQIDTDRMKAPAFKMLLTAVGAYAYRRPDGIFVVPIRCLGA